MGETRMVASGRWHREWVGDGWFLGPGQASLSFPHPPTVTLHLTTSTYIHGLREKANGLSSSDRFWRRHEGVAGTIEAGRKLISRVEE